MRVKRLAVLLAASFVCAGLLGCASVPKEKLDEKDAVISNLNTQIDALKQDMAKMQRYNEELSSAKTDLEQRLNALEAERAKLQKAAAEKTEKVK